MTALQLRFTGVVLFMMAAMTLLIRAQPFDDQSVRTLLMPTDCAMPCFMGIQPGVTTLEEAVAILKSSPWVDQVTDDPSTVGSSAITWTWSSLKPAVIRDGSSGLMLSHVDPKLGNIVDRVRIETTVPVGYAALLVNDHVTSITSGRNYADNQAYIEASDYQDSIRIWSIMDCPITKRKFLDTQARIDFDRRPYYTPAQSDKRGDYYWCWRRLN